jgi:hypothetical protein
VQCETNPRKPTAVSLVRKPEKVEDSLLKMQDNRRRERQEKGDEEATTKRLKNSNSFVLKNNSYLCTNTSICLNFTQFLQK